MKPRGWAFLLFAITLATIPTISRAQTGTWNSVTLSWTTPGDDSTFGSASQFDLRYSTSPINAGNFDLATRWNSMPTPAAPGTQQSVVVTGLSPSTTYYFAIKTADEVPNWSGISNLVSRATTGAPDVTRPAPMAISIGVVTDSTAIVAWVAVGDDSLTGTASRYDVRYSTSPINTSNWGSASQVTNEPTPLAAGTPQTCMVHGLGRQVTYYVAARAIDEANNTSALSNVPSFSTPDTAPPAAVRDLSANFFWLGWHTAMAVRVRTAEEIAR
jgi:hypothetical protein